MTVIVNHLMINNEPFNDCNSKPFNDCNNKLFSGCNSGPFNVNGSLLIIK
jgi:hypothetical protein